MIKTQYNARHNNMVFFVPAKFDNPA